MVCFKKHKAEGCSTDATYVPPAPVLLQQDSASRVNLDRMSRLLINQNSKTGAREDGDSKDADEERPRKRLKELYWPPEPDSALWEDPLLRDDVKPLRGFEFEAIGTSTYSSKLSSISTSWLTRFNVSLIRSHFGRVEAVAHPTRTARHSESTSELAPASAGSFFARRARSACRPDQHDLPPRTAFALRDSRPNCFCRGSFCSRKPQWWIDRERERAWKYAQQPREFGESKWGDS